MSRLRHRFSYRLFLVVLCAVSLPAAACGEDSSSNQPTATSPTTAATETTAGATASARTTTTTSPPETTSTTAPPPTTTTTAAPEFEPRVVSYRYPASGEVSYRMSIQQEADVTVESGSPEEDPPGPIRISSTLEGTISYQTGPGPEEGTTSIRILSDLALVANKMQMGGITVPSSPDSEAPGFETPIDITVVVDQQGNVLEIASEELDELFGGESFLSANSIGSQELSRPFGPAFPDHPVGIGDTWTERTEQEGPADMGMIVTTAEHRLVEVDTEGESPVLVVESQYRTEAFEWDMTEFLKEMFGAFTDELDSEEAREGQEAISELTMLVSASPTTAVAVTRFDSDAGLVLEGDYQVSGEVTTHMTIPDETGETTTIFSATGFDQTMTYQLITPAT